MSSEEIRAKAEAWLRTGGADQLRAAFEMARAANRKLREDARVDWRLLNEPMTV